MCKTYPCDKFQAAASMEARNAIVLRVLAEQLAKAGDGEPRLNAQLAHGEQVCAQPE